MITKKKKALAVIVALALGVMAFVLINLPKPVKSSDSSFNLAQIADGSYLGECDNGLVKVKVKVTVENNAIAEVQLLEHDNGLGGAAEVITNMVVQQQSVEVDKISGATMSSKTILKAVENALSKG